MATWDYVVAGLDGDRQQWLTKGRVESATFDGGIAAAREDSYQQLTEGETVYGQPGQGGCRGPYTITTFTITTSPIDVTVETAKRTEERKH